MAKIFASLVDEAYKKMVEASTLYERREAQKKYSVVVAQYIEYLNDTEE